MTPTRDFKEGDIVRYTPHGQFITYCSVGSILQVTSNPRGTMRTLRCKMVLGDWSDYVKRVYHEEITDPGFNAPFYAEELEVIGNQDL